MAPKVFREFGKVRVRDPWPLTFDLEGVERDDKLRKRKLEEEPMKALSPNSFATGRVIDINRPERIAYDPRQHQYPKMLYHKTRKDKNWVAEHKRLTLYNQLHPEKPEILPVVPAEFTLVHSAEEEEQRLKEGYAVRAPDDNASDEPEEVLCARGCGFPPHRGACKSV